MCRDNDFRASGSGKIFYEKEHIDKGCIELAFEASNKLKSQCMAYDFVFDASNKPLIVEISYTFSMHAYDECEGYWDIDLIWHKGKINPQDWMIESLL